MVFVTSTVMNIEFVYGFNALYVFPIVAVILCAFIVYAFGFKSPVQPPSFVAIDEERKSSKKRKAKETNKIKVVLNGKLNSSNIKVSVSNKKKESEKFLSADKATTEKTVIEKKIAKKSKLSNEKKVHQEKKKECCSQEDARQGGWVQLISKKERKIRKKDEATNFEKQTCIVKPVQNLQKNKSDTFILAEETSKAVIENLLPEKQFVLKDEVNENVPNVEDHKQNTLIIEDSKTDELCTEKMAFEENVLKNEKIKSKKRKKKNTEVNSYSSIVINPETVVEQVISEKSASLNSTNTFPVAAETLETLIGTTELNQSKEIKTSGVVFDELAGTTELNQTKENKTSNVVFDELAGLYPEPKEQRKKKKVRRDH